MGQLRGMFEACRFGRGRRRWSVSLAVLAVAVGGLGFSGCAADPPPVMQEALALEGGAYVSWQAPPAAASPITAYVVTPWIGFERQTPVVFNSTATTQAVYGLTSGVTYTFTVHAVHANGHVSAESGMSNEVVPWPGCLPPTCWGAAVDA